MLLPQVLVGLDQSIVLHRHWVCITNRHGRSLTGSTENRNDGGSTVTSIVTSASVKRLGLVIGNEIMAII